MTDAFTSDAFTSVFGGQRGFRVTGVAARLVAQAEELTSTQMLALHRHGWNWLADGALARSTYSLLAEDRPQVMKESWLRLHTALKGAGFIDDLHVREAAEQAVLAAVGLDLISDADYAALMAGWRHML